MWDSDVVIENTGSFWIPLFQILEKQGLKIFLLKQDHLKNFASLTKMHRLDCQTIQKHHAYGLLSSPLKADDQISMIRILLRNRDKSFSSNRANILYTESSLWYQFVSF